MGQKIITESEHYLFGAGALEIAAVLAIISGSMSFVSTFLFPFEAAQRLYRGAGDFLALRENIELELNRPGVTDKQLFSAYEKLNQKYVHLSQDYEQYFAAHHAKDKIIAGAIVPAASL